MKKDVDELVKIMNGYAEAFLNHKITKKRIARNNDKSFVMIGFYAGIGAMLIVENYDSKDIKTASTESTLFIRRKYNI